MTFWGKLALWLSDKQTRCRSCGSPLKGARQDTCSQKCEQDLENLQAW